MLRAFALSALLSSVVLSAQAATVTESADFSDDWFNPSPIAAGATKVTGVVDDLDVLRLQGLAAGAQTLRFTFSAESYYTSGDYTAGGSILASDAAFRWGWDHDWSKDYKVSFNSWNLGTPYYGSKGALTGTFDLNLGAGFAGGDLWLALVPWNGLKLDYAVSYASTGATAPQAAPLPAVPLPATGLLLGGVAALGFLARKRRAARG